MRDWLKAARDTKQLTTKQVADSLGVSEVYYKQIENGTRQQSLDMSLIRKFGSLFDIPVQRIIALEIGTK